MDEMDHMDYVVEEMSRDTADLFNRLDITDLIPA